MYSDHNRNAKSEERRGVRQHTIFSMERDIIRSLTYRVNNKKKGLKKVSIRLYHQMREAGGCSEKRHPRWVGTIPSCMLSGPPL